MLSEIDDDLADDAILLTIRPHKIAGRYVNETDKVFHQYTPLSAQYVMRFSII